MNLERCRWLCAEFDKALKNSENSKAVMLFDELVLTLLDGLSAIYLLSDRTERIVLIDYYLNWKTVNQIANELQYTTENVFRIKRRALKNLEKLLSADEAPNSLNQAETDWRISASFGGSNVQKK